MAAKQKLTKARTKARNRKMNMIARMLELPGNVGPAAPASPQATLATLRQEQRRNRLGSNFNTTPTQRTSPSPRNSGSGYRPMFDSTLRVPGSATQLKPREKQRLRRPSPRRDTGEGIPLEPISPRRREHSSSEERRMEEEGAVARRDRQRGSVELGREAETSFETTPTWYVDSGLSEGSRSGTEEGLVTTDRQISGGSCSSADNQSINNQSADELATAASTDKEES